MKDDMAIRHDVLSELDWDPRFDSRNIGVAVKNGVVALSGHVGSYAERRAAEEAAKSVVGVKALANDIIIELPFEAKRTDAEIAEAAVAALRGNISVPAGDIKLVVRDGWVTLEGQVAMWYQKNAAEMALASLRGVTGIMNNIAIRTVASAIEVKSKIEEAIRRRAVLDAQNITVKTAGSAVTLEGHVSSWAERQQAEMAAWQAPGVSKVIDNLNVQV
ncbi:MAG TPA: BON domain-containing protein [Steroidobacteraceae bacterium]|nr:BON domain-containing protein [Steroidobacteraceae bacterium]